MSDFNRDNSSYNRKKPSLPKKIFRFFYYGTPTEDFPKGVNGYRDLQADSYEDAEKQAKGWMSRNKRVKWVDLVLLTTLILIIYFFVIPLFSSPVEQPVTDKSVSTSPSAPKEEQGYDQIK